MEVHCYDGPVYPAPKREIQITSIEHLREVVDESIRTGTTPKLHLGGLLTDPRAWVILERIVSDHPRSQPDAQPHQEAKAQAQAQAETEAEVVTYSAGALEPQTYRDMQYQVVEDATGFRVKLLSPCGGSHEPWDFPFDSIEDADAHGRAAIDQLCAKPGDI